MKIRIEIDVPEYVGGTLCHECPIEKYSRLCYHGMKYCKECDLSRIEIKELEKKKMNKIEVIYADKCSET